MVEGDQRDILAATITAFELSLGGEASAVAGASPDLLAGCALSLGAEHGVGFDISTEGDGAKISAGRREIR